MKILMLTVSCITLLLTSCEDEMNKGIGAGSDGKEEAFTSFRSNDNIKEMSSDSLLLNKPIPNSSLE